MNTDSHLFEPDEYECSYCNAVFKKKYPSCPNCGSSLYAERTESDFVDEAEKISRILDGD